MDNNDGQAVAFTQHFSSGPPLALVLKDDGDFDTMAIEKQEEWIKKRKVEQVTTKQIETRVKRQVVVNEDGQVLDDSGPQVTTRTTEDTETKREEHTEKTGGDEDGTVATLPPEGWVAIPGAVIVREKHEKKSNTRDEIDERLETEEVHHLGHLTNQELEEALERQRETGQALTCRRRQSSVSGGSSGSESGERQLVAPYSTGKRIVHQSRKHKRIIDQDNTEERSEEKDGRITTETKRHEHHEEIDDNEEPEDERPASDTSSIHEVVKESRNNYTTHQDEDQVEYVVVPKGGHISGGVKLGHGPLQTTQKTVQYGDPDVVDGQQASRLNGYVAEQQQFASPAPVQPSKLVAQAPVGTPQETAEQTAERTDALTKKPLDLEAEEETRKLETSRWLDSHFGSESSAPSSTDGGGGSAKGSKIGLAGSKTGKTSKEKMPSQVSSGGINVTMKSDPSGSDRYDPSQPLANEPLANARIYSTGFNRSSTQQQSQRIQAGPQSPSYKKMSPPSYQSPVNNGKPELYRNLSAGDQDLVKRATSFNHSAGRATGTYSWMNKEELKGHQSNPLAARQSFLQSMNKPMPAEKYHTPASAGQQMNQQQPTYAAPNSQVRRWPPPVKPLDDDDAEDLRTSTPVYQAPHQHQTPNRSGGTIIRLGPTLDYSSSNGRKPSGPNSGITRTQSLLHTPGTKQQPFSQQDATPERMYSSPVSNNMVNQQHNTTSRMNLLNSSLQSVPEREQRSNNYSSQSQGYYVDTEKSFQSLNRSNTSVNSKGIQSYAIKTPPPRPAPPSSNHYGSPTSMFLGPNNNNKVRVSESFRSPKSPPMFAVEEPASPPVRPVRRKQSKRINATTVKTDSGTQCNPQTIRNDTFQQQQQQQQQYQSQTLDRPGVKPMKKYYMGEDPFTASKAVVVNGKMEVDKLSPVQPNKAARNEVVRSQTLPRRPSKQPLLSDTSMNNSANISNNMTNNLSSSRFFSDQDRSMNETIGAALNSSGINKSTSRIVPITPSKSVPNNNNNNNTISSNRNNSLSVTNLSSAVNRSQSFQVGHNQSTSTASNVTANNNPAGGLQQRRSSLLSSTPLRSVSIRGSNLNSPLYKSTSFLNRTSGAEQPFASLKSPGIVTSISKSQLDLNKSTTELNSFQQPQPYSSSALYTLPRRRSNATSTTATAPKVAEPDAEWVRQPVDVQPSQSAQTSSKVQSGISERLAQLSSPPTSPTLDDSTRGESYSSLHRRKMQAAAAAVSSASPSTPPPPPPPPQPTEPPAQPLSFQSSTKSTHRSFRGVTSDTIKEENESAGLNSKTQESQQPELEPEARSLKDRIAFLENAGIHYANPAQTLPRVVGGKPKPPPPATPPKTYNSPAPPGMSKAERMATKEESPEVESIEKRQKFLEGLLNSAPELFMHIHGDENLKDIRINREDVIDGKSPDGRLPRTPSPPSQSAAGFNNRVYTSTPVAGGKINQPAPLTPPPLLIRNNSGGSPFGSQRDLLTPLRRGSLTLSNAGSIGSNGGVIIPAVKIPAPVNYSETVRIKSNQDPDSQSDSIQSYSKRVQPFVDGFSSETKQSSQQTTMSRSEYTTSDRPSDHADMPRLSPSIYHSIRPQQSGGVIITVRGNDGQ